MIHTPIAVKHRISNAVLWYGEDYDIKRAQENQYHEKSGDYEKAQNMFIKEIPVQILKIAK